jgi:glucose-6-phosphate 1-dehydrogenase
MTRADVQPHLFVVFGATGDLAKRKLTPAIYHLIEGGALKERCLFLGVGRRSELDDGAFGGIMRESLEAAGLVDRKSAAAWCNDCVFYQPLGKGASADYAALAERIASIERERGLPGNRIFYLALPPAAVPAVIEQLGGAGLSRSPGWTRLVVEKPFGHDLASAEELNRHVHGFFEESQTYRIDHYLGKETVQNLLVFRFANSIFESIWNRDRIDHVEITMAESLGVEHRAGYYERAGALRDMVQNHLAQLLTLIAMEGPAVFEAGAVRQEKVKVLKSIMPVDADHVVYGQYAAGTVGNTMVPGYREEPGVASDSQTPTFVAMRLDVDTWRWQGVPFYIRTGKRMPQRTTQICVVFERPPVCFFRKIDSCTPRSNVLTITLQPDEGFTLSFDVKKPGQPFSLEPRSFDFSYGDAFGPLPDAYETLLLDIIIGDQTLFVHADEVEASWRLFTPILEAQIPVRPYAAGAWGPGEADELLMREGRKWRLP